MPQQPGLLILSSASPPVPRLLKFIEHLPELGWRPVLLAPRRPGAGDLRFEGARALALPVVETRFLPTPGALARQAVGRIAAARGGPAAEPASSGAAPARRAGAMGRLRRLLAWTSTPDELVGWLPWAAWHGRALVRRHRIDALLASGPPFSVVLAGLLLKRWTGLPLVSDFRDAWLLDPLDPLGTVGGAFEAPPSAAREALLRRLEARVVNGSDHLLFTSQTTREAYARAYPGAGARSTLLYNGVEEGDFLPAADPSCPFALTYVGTLHPFQSGQVAALVRAYGIALSREPGLAASQLRLFGHRPAALDALVAETARAAGAAAHLRLGGVVPHRQAVSLVKSRGLVLVFAGESAFTRPSKISDALAAGRPILALAAEDSETARSVRPFGHLVYSGADPEELARLILAAWQRHRADPADAPPFPFPAPHPLNWRTAAAGLAQILAQRSGARLE